MYLHAKAVVLRLHADGAELLDHRLWIREALGQLRPERMTGSDLQRLQPGLARLPERARDEAEVGRAVVRTLQDRSKGAVSFFRNRQRVQDRRVADAQAHL